MIKNKGFTLIELLVVIAIIGLLSSVVLASLNTAREKARLGAIKQEMVQLRSVLNLNYSATAGYTNLRTSSNFSGSPQWNAWVDTQADCTFSYGPGSTAATADPVGAAQMLPICQKIVGLANKSDVQSNATLLIGNNTGDSSKTSINVFPYDASSNLYCVGSSGVTFTATAPPLLTIFDDKGCYYNP